MQSLRKLFSPPLRVWVILGAVTAASWVGCSNGAAETEVFEASFAVTGSPKLEAMIDNGRIEVVSDPTGGDTVKVTATVRQPDQVEYSAVKESDTIEIRGKADEEFNILGGGGGGVDLEVSVPLHIELSLESSNGQLVVNGTTGSISAKTSNGRVSISNTNGDIRIETSNGRVDLMDVNGQVDVQTSNGSIEYRGTPPPGSDNTLQTSNGSVDVSLVGTAGVNLDATTSNGDIESSLPITIEGESKDDELVGIIGDGGSSLTIRTSNGDINIQ